MPAPRQKRVPDDFGRLVLQRLDRSGELEVLIGLLYDHEDSLQEKLTRRLAAAPFSGDPKELAELQAAQGALREIGLLAQRFLTLARTPEPLPQAPDALTRPALPTGQGKRVRARF